MGWSIIVAPLLGGIIGYITNDLAIKMLFRPRRAVYIGKFHVPFTPGLIPAQKKRIAGSIGRVISNQLLNAETMQKTLLSPKTLQNMKSRIQELIDSFAHDGRSIREVLGTYVEPDKMDAYQTSLTKTVSAFLVEKLVQAHIGTTIVELGVQTLRKSSGVVEKFLDDKLANSIRDTISPKVDSLIREKAPDLLESEIGKLEENLLDMKLEDIYAANRERIPAAVDRVMELYTTVLDSNLDKLLAAVNIERIVVERVNSFSSEQLENMIFGIMKRELNAIVYLGAALGFLMGFINLLF